MVPDEGKKGNNDVTPFYAKGISRSDVGASFRSAYL